MDPRLAGIARSQAGMFSRAQASSCGYSQRRIRTELTNGRWLVVVAGVYRLAGAPGGWAARVWAALLVAGEGAVLGGRPAGRVYHLDGVPAYQRLEIAVPANRRPRLSVGARVEPTSLPARDVTVRGGVPILTPERTVVDLTRREDGGVGVRIVGDALRSGIVTRRRVANQIEAARGRRGVDRARAAFTLADPRLESVLEAELLALINAAGLTAVPQFEVFHRGLFIARLDFAVVRLKLGIEADGYNVHALRPAFERDRERSALLQLAGWTSLSFTAHQIRRREMWVRNVISEMDARLRSAALKSS
jgi:very-short-patch-repair endonuclease